MDCILCDKEIKSEEQSLEVFTTDNKKTTVHRDCYNAYVKSMSLCGPAGCSNCPGCQ
jgi:hypothetical protein